LKKVVYSPPLTSILSPHQRGERKKDAGQPPVKINLFLVSVLKIGFLPVKLAKIWINEKLRYYN
jgi:hypothetical protein